MNVVNFSDGVDGLAAGVCAISAVGVRARSRSTSGATARGVLAADHLRRGARLPAAQLPPGVGLHGRLRGDPARPAARRDDRRGLAEDERPDRADRARWSCSPCRSWTRRFVVAKRMKYRRARLPGRLQPLPPPLRTASASRSAGPCSTSTRGRRRWPASRSRCASCPTPTTTATSAPAGASLMGGLLLLALAASASTSSTCSRSSSSSASGMAAAPRDPDTAEHEIDAQVERGPRDRRVPARAGRLRRVRTRLADRRARLARRRPPVACGVSMTVTRHHISALGAAATPAARSPARRMDGRPARSTGLALPQRTVVGHPRPRRSSCVVGGSRSPTTRSPITMHSHPNAAVARTIAEDRQRVLRGHAVHQPAVARPGPPARGASLGGARRRPRRPAPGRRHGAARHRRLTRARSRAARPGVRHARPSTGAPAGTARSLPAAPQARRPLLMADARLLLLAAVLAALLVAARARVGGRQLPRRRLRRAAAERLREPVVAGARPQAASATWSAGTSCGSRWQTRELDAWMSRRAAPPAPGR